MKEKILVSACLLGTPCRYDGKSKPNPEVQALEEQYELIPICPEVDGGLETPRLPCEVKGDRIIREDGQDFTEPFSKGAKIALMTAQQNNCKAAVLKEKSPSCGKNFRYDGSFQGKLIEGSGFTASLLQENGILVFSENEIEELKRKL